MENRMLVTQALDERDLLVKKIGDKIQKASFVDTARKNEEKVLEGCMPRTEYCRRAESAYQQIMDLISRYQQIDAAIVASNASTWIETSYGRFTVAGAISLRGRLRCCGVYEEEADFETNLCEKMEQEYQSRVQAAEAKNKQLQSTAEQMRLSILGRDSKAREEKPLEVMETYVRENTTELVDPLDIRRKIELLEEKRDTLLKELDTQIKVSNATTFITLGEPNRMSEPKEG